MEGKRRVSEGEMSITQLDRWSRERSYTVHVRDGGEKREKPRLKNKEDRGMQQCDKRATVRLDGKRNPTVLHLKFYQPAVSAGLT